jgi:Lar family restriction alleviation protein
MSETEKLLPCPFCGGEPADYEIAPHTHKFATFMPDHPGSHVIECAGCGVGIIQATKDAALAAWNRRAHLAKRDVVEVPRDVDDWFATLAKAERAAQEDGK